MPYLRPYRKLLLGMVIMGLYGSAMDAVIPLFQQYAINHFVGGSTLTGLGLFIGLYALVVITQVISNYISAFGACKAELYIGRDLKRASFNHLQTLSFSYFNRNSVGYVHAPGHVRHGPDRLHPGLGPYGGGVVHRVPFGRGGADAGPGLAPGPVDPGAGAR